MPNCVHHIYLTACGNYVSSDAFLFFRPLFTVLANDVTGLKESEEKLKQQQQESARRENILVMRLATKEQEMQECTVCICYYYYFFFMLLRCLGDGVRCSPLNIILNID